MPRAKELIAGTIFLITALVSAPAGAACTVSTQSVPFGGYSTLNPAVTDGVGNVHVACTATTSFVVALGPGGGTIPARMLASGAYRLNYNLYTNVSRLTLWGNGVNGGVTVSGSGTSVNLPVYGRIPARQNLRAGAYSDVVAVTITF